MSEKTVYRIYFQDMDDKEHTEEFTTEEVALLIARQTKPPVRVIKVTITEREEEIFRVNKVEEGWRVSRPLQPPLGRY